MAQTLGRDDEALELCARCIADAPGDAPGHVDALILHANLLHKLRRIEDALSSLDAALARSPRDARVLSNKGVMLHDLGEWTAAAASFDAALAEKPDFAEAWLGRGNVALKSLCLEKALECFDRVLELSPGRYDFGALRQSYGARRSGPVGRSDGRLRSRPVRRPAYADAQANRATAATSAG